MFNRSSAWASLVLWGSVLYATQSLAGPVLDFSPEATLQPGFSDPSLDATRSGKGIAFDITRQSLGTPANVIGWTITNLGLRLASGSGWSISIYTSPGTYSANNKLTDISAWGEKAASFIVDGKGPNTLVDVALSSPPGWQPFSLVFDSSGIASLYILVEKSIATSPDAFLYYGRKTGGSGSPLGNSDTVLQIDLGVGFPLTGAPITNALFTGSLSYQYLYCVSACNSPGGPSGAPGVPEPATLALSVIGGLGLLSVRRRSVPRSNAPA